MLGPTMIGNLRYWIKNEVPKIKCEVDKRNLDYKLKTTSIQF